MLLCFSCLHNSHNHSIDNIFALVVYIRIYLVVLGLRTFRVLVSLSWHVVNLKVLILELQEHLNSLLWLEFSLSLILLGENLLFRVTEVHKSTLEQMSILDAGVLLNLVEGQHLVLVEQEQDHSLVAVSDDGVVLRGGEDWFDFY